MATKYSLVSNTYGGKFPDNRYQFNMSVSQVPVNKSMGYESLTHNNKQSGSGHYTVRNAYVKPCTTFTPRQCGTVVVDAGSTIDPDGTIKSNYGSGCSASSVGPDGQVKSYYDDCTGSQH